MCAIHTQIVPTTLEVSDALVTPVGEDQGSIPSVLISTSAVKEHTNVPVRRPDVLILLEVITVFAKQDGGKFPITSVLISTNAPREVTAVRPIHAASTHKARIVAIATDVITNLDTTATMTVV